MFLAPKIKYCLTINDLGIIEQHKTFEGFNDSKRLLDRPQKFNMIEGKKITAMLPRSWKKSFNNGIIKHTKIRRCDISNDKLLCEKCNNQVNKNKEFEANLNLLKRNTPNDFGYMLPYYEVKVVLKNY